MSNEKDLANTNINWYPGHMTKARRMMEEDVKLVDLVIEIVDARLPLSSRNPDIDLIGRNKARLILMNKSDMADPDKNNQWAEYFKSRGFYVVMANSKTGEGIKQIDGEISKACRDKTERDKKRGILNRPLRAMVAGIPNVGKSTFINAYVGKNCAKTGNKPGVTRGKQWICLDRKALGRKLELLDTPGLLWPKLEDQSAALKLALSGSIKDDILNVTELAMKLAAMLAVTYPDAIRSRYGIEYNGRDDKGICEQNILEKIAEARACRMKGDILDIDKAGAILIDDFRSGKLGRITLETP